MAMGALSASGILVWWVPFVNLLPLGSLTLWWLPILPYYMFISVYVEITRFVPLLLAMFFTNGVYFGFHPTVAPELLGDSDSSANVLNA